MQTTAIVGVLWLIFIIVWFVSALGAKRTLNRPMGAWMFRIVFVVVVTIVLTHTHTRLQTLFVPPFPDSALAWLGALLVALGVGLAVWARFYLGRNWGMPMSVKENPSLVTTGPYRYIRNPIYSGMFLAMLGSALAVGLWWLIVLVGAGSYFLYAAKGEEKILAKEFPNEYPAYKARTYALVPFIY